MKRTTAAVLLAALTGCVSYHGETPLDVQPVPALEARERWLVVAIREPEIKLEPLFEGGEEGPWTSIQQLTWAMLLIESMRATGLYREVDFEGQLACAPHIVLEVHENPRLYSCDPDWPYGFILVGIIPAGYTCDHGHYFSRVDRPDQRFEFPWHATTLFGWLMPLDWGSNTITEVEDAAHLIRVLRGTGLFTEVDLSRQLDCAPDIEIIPRHREGNRFEEPPLWLVLVTLSLFIQEQDEGISFAPASKPDVVFDFPYPTTLVVGILPLIALPVTLPEIVPGWSLAGPRVEEEVKLFLLSNADRFRPFAINAEPTPCQR